ncbi:MAG: 2-succinyl-6-hydroxy-2,4-cyclohexadiene-1-carboxylate synthase [Chloroflexota bacterium]|nr:2-succinyl-6-hydroxy-2,4-cyclohexadiene-1-carboxylate synthase [Chloroflexota bacterium]
MRIEVNGIGYNVEAQEYGHDAPPLVMLHGFTGSTRSWDGHGERIRSLASARYDWHGHTLVLVDLLGHGLSDSPDDPDRYRMERATEDVAAILDALGHQRPAAIVGYSMGGRLALHFAVTHPERVAALILESASPGIADSGERQRRVESDAELAEYIEREGIPAFVEQWEANPLFESQRSLPEHVRGALRAERLRNKPVGLANSLRGMGAGAQEPLWDRLGEIQVPVLLLAGEHDAKFRAILEQMWDALPPVGAAVVPGAGHAVHLEQPESFDRRVVEFLWGDLPGWSSREEIQWQ